MEYSKKRKRGLLVTMDPLEEALKKKETLAQRVEELRQQLLAKGTRDVSQLAAALVEKYEEKEPAPTRLRVLVIDDSQVLLRSVTRALRQHSVTAADSYAKAVRILLREREEFDVVLCDLLMPDGTGMDLHRRLKAERPEVLPQMVYMTGSKDKELLEFLGENTARCLAKPLNATALREAVFLCRNADKD